MVVKKRLDYGFQIDRIPVIPRAPRSVRRRGSRKKLVEDSQICAFELLAAVAGKLLLESESSTSSNAQEGKIQVENFKNEEKNLKSECFDQGSCVESEFTRDSPPQLEDVNLDLKLDISTKLDSNSAPGGSGSGSGSANGMIKANSGSVKECVNNNNNNNNTVVINSEGSVQLQPLYREERKEGKLGIIIDDDENSFGFKGNKVKTFRPQSRFGYRRIRKILTSKYWKSGSKLKDFEYSDHYEGMKPFYRNRKSLYTREGSSKRRKMNDHTFVVGSDQEASSESISNEPDNKGPSGIQKSRDANVKLSIKSFKVPELYVEVPETATIGALKRTVLEAVKAILGGNLRVGVIVKGKKVRDDYRTLEQAGISDINNLENLGFTLEPSFNYVSPKVSPKKPRDPVKKLPRSPIIPYVELGVPINETPVTKTEKTVEINHELTILPPRTPNDGAFIGPPIMNAEALAVVPVGLGLGLGSGQSPNPKPKRTELSQRRTRRPFSVGEVEALVEAVEKLGTGRWRDVKMRAFDNADHRTYVDLKDKWKTLVHTASISPQQRRGEPVPQELLDRVLAAHGYWSQNQSKQQVKQQHHVEALRITDGLMEGVIA